MSVLDRERFYCTTSVGDFVSFIIYFLDFKLPEETSEDSPRPTVVLYRENGTNVAVGYLQPERQTLHGKPVPRGCDIVQVTWVANKEGGVATLSN